LDLGPERSCTNLLVIHTRRLFLSPVEERANVGARSINPSRAVLIRISDGQRIEIGETATAGRLDECEVRLVQGHASRNHARLTFREGALFVEDLRSANGTFVNDARVLSPVRLRTGDRVRFDIEEFSVEIPKPVPAAAGPTAPRAGFTASQTVFDPAPPAMTEVARAGLPGSSNPVQVPAPPRATPAAAAPAAKPVAPPASVPPTAAAPPATAPARVTPADSPPVRSTPAAPSVRATPAAGSPSPKSSAANPAVSVAVKGGASDPGGKKRPGAWADTMAGRPGDSKSTKYIPPGEIASLMEGVAAVAPATPDLDAPHLQIVSGRRQGVSIALAGGRGINEWSVGSDPEREIVLPDDGVSAFHARLINDRQRWKVIDQMSANGTYVNGKRGSVTYLSFGDRIMFGPIECIFQAPSDETAGGRGGARWVATAVAVACVLGVLFLGYWMLR
jgi:pSer/pThr/pTyr-binding forkhead associated (FHA) protein